MRKRGESKREIQWRRRGNTVINKREIQGGGGIARPIECVTAAKRGESKREIQWEIQWRRGNARPVIDCVTAAKRPPLSFCRIWRAEASVYQKRGVHTDC
jgi:hypothetical protein